MASRPGRGYHPAAVGVFFLFLLALAAGVLTTLFSIPEDDLGRGYFRMNALVVLSLLALGAAVTLLHPLRPFGPAARAGGVALGSALVAGFLYYAAVSRERWILARGAATVALGGCAAALWLAGLHLTPVAAPLPHRPALLAAALGAAALFLGWSLTTMLLGHWYLVAPRLAFRHLVVFCWILLATTALRGAAVAASLAEAAGVAPLTEPHPWRLVAGFDGQGMFLWFRLLWGILGPLVLALMALHCARRRSNQSATGILYVLVVGAFIGEITALYIILTTGVPV